MANRVENYIYLEGEQTRINQVLQDIKFDNSAVGTIDFNKVIPMPKTLKIEPSPNTEKAFFIFKDFLFGYAKKTFGTRDDGIVRNKNFNEILQLAEKFNNSENFKKAQNEYKKKYNISDEMLDLGNVAFVNKTEYGYFTGYEWCIEKWGTKWNSYGYEYGDESQNLAENNTIRFNTAWSAPIPVVAELSNKYPDIEFTIEWADECIYENCGRVTFREGRKIEEYYPETEKETIEYACGILGYDSPNDIGLYLNASETGYIDVINNEYQLIEFKGQKALFTNERVTEEDIPKGMYCYALTEKDDGSGFATIEPTDRVNHGGTIITKEPIDFGEKGYISLTDESTPDFLSQKDITIEDYMSDKFEENTEGMEQML